MSPPVPPLNAPPRGVNPGRDRAPKSGDPGSRTRSQSPRSGTPNGGASHVGFPVPWTRRQALRGPLRLVEHRLPELVPGRLEHLRRRIPECRGRPGGAGGHHGPTARHPGLTPPGRRWWLLAVVVACALPKYLAIQRGQGLDSGARLVTSPAWVQGHPGGPSHRPESWRR